MHDRQRWFKVTLLFPLRDNEGNAFEEEVWRWWNRRMTRLFQGFTDRGVVKGFRRGQSDLNREIMINVKTEREVASIREFLQEARKKFRQKKMYLEYHPVFFEEVE